MKIRIRATQLIEVPEGSEIIDEPGEQLIKIEGLYYKPEIEFIVELNFVIF